MKPLPIHEGIHRFASWAYLFAKPEELQRAWKDLGRGDAKDGGVKREVVEDALAKRFDLTPTGGT